MRFPWRRHRHAEHMKPVQGLTTELTDRLHEVNLHLETFAVRFGDMAEQLRAAESCARRAGDGDDGRDD